MAHLADALREYALAAGLLEAGAYPELMTVVDKVEPAASAITPEAIGSLRPQTLVLTFLGNAVLGRNIAVVSASFIDVLARLGVAEQAARSTLTRMVNRGLLARYRRGRHTYFGLTPRAVAVLTEGEHRVWRVGAVNGDGEPRWTLLGFSLPESRRDDRHLIRSRLRWAGFGLLRSGLWIAPGVVDVAAVLPDRRLLNDVLVFLAEPAEPTDIDQVVGEAYDLDAIASGYRRFLHRWDRPRPLSAAPDDLARLLWLLSEWFLLLRDDPRLPRRHLPSAWPAGAAEELFHRHHAQLQPAARRITDAVLDVIELGTDSTPQVAGTREKRPGSPVT